MQGGGDADEDGNFYFFSAPASPVHYILRSPPSSTAAASSSPYYADADCCAAAGDFEFAAHGAAGTHGGGPAGTKGGVEMMSSAEELFVAGRIRVGCLSPIRQEDDAWEDCGGGGDDDEDRERDARSPRAATRRARSVSPTRSPRGAATADPSHPLASASSSSSSSAKNIRRRMSLRELFNRTGGDYAGADQQASPGCTAGAEVTSRFGFWPPSIWPSSRSSKKSPDSPSPVPCPAPPQPGRRRSTSSDRAAAVPTMAKRAPPGGSTRRTTSLPYRQGMVLGCLGFGARGYGLAKSMHPLPSR